MIFYPLSFFFLLFYTMPIESIPESWARWHAASFYFINYWNTWIPVSFIRVSPRIFISSSFNSGVWHFTDCVPATMAGRARNARDRPLHGTSRESHEISMAIKFHGRRVILSLPPPSWPRLKTRSRDTFPRIFRPPTEFTTVLRHTRAN